MKFTYNDTEYDLIEIIGKENTFVPDDAPQISCITKDGIIKLEQKFPNVRLELHSLANLKFGGKDIISLMAEISDVEYGSEKKGTSHTIVAEVSPDNIKNEFWAKYPLAILESRAKSRAWIRFLGLSDLVGEEELTGNSEVSDLTDTENTNGNHEKVDETEEKLELVKNIKWQCDKQGITSEERVKLYRNQMTDPLVAEEDIFDNITASQLKKVKKVLQDRYFASKNA